MLVCWVCSSAERPFVFDDDVAQLTNNSQYIETEKEREPLSHRMQNKTNRMGKSQSKKSSRQRTVDAGNFVACGFDKMSDNF